MKKKEISNERIKGDYLYILLITLIWLITYIICSIAWKQNIGWDETSYLSTAKGIAQDFDFSSRFNSVLGLIKYSFPQHTHHYPVYSTYLAIFFKLFGVSLNVAYFSTWLAGLVACVFIYLIMLLLTENDKLFSFFIAVSFLFLPRIINYCDTAMMEIPGCALIMIFSYFVFKDISKNKLNPFLLAIASLWLYFYKSLFIGAVIGFIFLILIAYKLKSINLVLKNKLSFPQSLGIYFGTVSVIYIIFTKFVFLPLAPMMTFHPRQIQEGTYADFAGGFFHNPINNALLNMKSFFQNVISHFYPSFPVFLYPGEEGYYIPSANWCELGLFFLVFVYVIIFSFLAWRNLSSLNKVFTLFTVISIVSFNLIFILLATSCVGLCCRYNMIYTPLLLILASIHLREFLLKDKIRAYIVILTFLVLVYVPFFISEIKVGEWSKGYYSDIARKNTQVVSNVLGDSKPMFIYFNNGIHTIWVSYPTRTIIYEATNALLKQINLKLSKPIEYLFLQPENILFKENEDSILKGEPIIDHTYTFHSVDTENKVVIYKYNPELF